MVLVKCGDVAVEIQNLCLGWTGEERWRPDTGPKTEKIHSYVAFYGQVKEHININY